VYLLCIDETIFIPEKKGNVFIKSEKTGKPYEYKKGDWKYIKSVHKQYGSMTLNTYPHQNIYSFWRYRLTQEWIDILNYLDYVKKDALTILEDEIGWKYYGGKHYESIYTRFYQGYILPIKFGFDKRRTHLSSLICSGEITRDEALEELKNPTYDPQMQESDREYVIKKLGISENEFEWIMNLEPKSYNDYPSYGSIYQSSLYRMLRSVYRSVKSAVHS